MDAYHCFVNMIEKNEREQGEFEGGFCQWGEWTIHIFGLAVEFRHPSGHWPMFTCWDIARLLAKNPDDIDWPDIFDFKMEMFDNKTLRQILMECDEKDCWFNYD